MEKAAIILFLLALSQVFAQDCMLVVPPNPLSSTGLATPYRLLAPCNQSDPMMATFVQGAVLDVAAGKMYVYNPLVITDGTAPLVQPTLPALPGSPVVGLWFGTNAGTVTLVDNAGSLAAGNCINGIAGSIFGQFAYCNAVSFFAAAYGAINAGILVVPPLGVASDGEVCPSIRDFFIIDMDQSDNVVTEYIVVGTAIAQMTTANKGIFTGANKLTNGSDNRLLSIAIDGALGCIPWRAPDLADAQNTVGLPALPLLEIQAAKYQANPALVPISHAMARVNNQPNLDKVNAYRAGVGQTPAAKVTDADSLLYCQNFYYTAPRRLSKNQALFFNAGSPDPVLATNLFAFLGQRFAGAFGPDGLNCANLLNVAPPVVPVKNAGGVFVGATITVPQQPGATQPTLNQNTIIIIVVCSVGGVLLIAGLIVGVIWYRNRSMYS